MMDQLRQVYQRTRERLKVAELQLEKL